MPIYEFQCTKCKEIFEDLVSIGQKTHKCPLCGAKSKKIMSSVGIIFKGSGWYCTDNRRKTALNSNGAKKVGKEDKQEVEKPDSSDTKAEKTTSKKSDSSGADSSGTKSDDSK